MSAAQKLRSAFLKSRFHSALFCSREEKKKVSFERSVSVKICKNQLTNQIEEKASIFISL